MSIKKFLALACCCMLTMWGSNACAAEVVWPKRLIISVAASGNPTTMVTTAIAHTIEKHTPIQRVIVQPIGGIKNFGPMAAKGEVDISVHSAADLFMAIYGQGDYTEQKFPFFRAVLPAIFNPFVVMTTPDKKINNLEDLRGKVLYTRNPGNTLFDPITDVLLKSVDMTQADLKASLTKANNAVAIADIIENRADGMAAPVMSNVILELRQAKGECLLITPTAEQVAKIKDELPFGFFIGNFEANIPAFQNTQPLLNVPVYRSGLFVHEKMQKELVYELVKVILDNREEWIGSHPMAADFGVMSTGFPVYHEGAWKYYEEHNMLTDEIRAEQETFIQMLKTNQ